MDEERAAKLSIIGLFFALLGVSLAVRRAPVRRLTSAEWLQLGIAAHRIGRAVAFERVGTPIRQPFTETRPDDTGAGETVVARGRGVRWVLGELLSCPTCSATWAAGVLAAGWQLAPRLTGMVVTVFSAAGVAHLLDSIIEWLTWAGRADRTEVGEHHP